GGRPARGRSAAGACRRTAGPRRRADERAAGCSNAGHPLSLRRTDRPGWSWPRLLLLSLPAGPGRHLPPLGPMVQGKASLVGAKPLRLKARLRHSREPNSARGCHNSGMFEAERDEAPLSLPPEDPDLERALRTAKGSSRLVLPL